MVTGVADGGVEDEEVMRWFIRRRSVETDCESPGVSLPFLQRSDQHSQVSPVGPRSADAQGSTSNRRNYP
jgi:hypothetical protein